MTNAPTPWSLCPHRNSDTILVDANNNDVAKVYGETRREAKAIAEYIVACVNAKVSTNAAPANYGPNGPICNRCGGALLLCHCPEEN